MLVVWSRQFDPWEQVTGDSLKKRKIMVEEFSHVHVIDSS